MARRSGKVLFAGKPKVQGSYYIPKLAAVKMALAAKRTGKSDSNIIALCLLAHADKITFAETAAQAEAGA